MTITDMQKLHFTSAIKILAIVVCGFPSSISLADMLHGQVIAVADGDTLTILDTSNQQLKIRLTGIDAPEKKQSFGQVSKQHLAAMVFGKPVAVEWFKKDRYQRILGKILLDGRDVNLEQIRLGMAWHYKKYEREQPVEDRRLYADAETKAQQGKLGLWRETNPVPPWEWRHH